jgi:hypothetical protein
MATAAKVFPVTGADTRTPTTVDLIPLAEVCRRLALTRRTVKALSRDCGLPLVRIRENGLLYGFWSEIEEWMRSQNKQRGMSR